MDKCFKWFFLLVTFKWYLFLQIYYRLNLPPSVDKYESRTLQTKNTIFSPTFQDINQQQSKIMICISQKAHTNKRVLPNIKQDEIKCKFQPLLSEPEFIVPLKTKAVSLRNYRLNLNPYNLENKSWEILNYNTKLHIPCTG